MSSPFLFAFIVGIKRYNEHSQCESLSNAVADAWSMKSFLTSRLKVPERNIRVLCNELATYSRITSTFRSHFINNPDIQKGDPILFFYAGYGSTCIDSHDVSNPQRRIQTICPSDRRQDVVPDITEREIDFWLLELAAAKGDNITVIMDCSHSGGRRQPSADQKITPRLRYAPPLRPTRRLLVTNSPNTIPDESKTPETESERPVERPSLSSSVLLKACRDNGSAWEGGGLGMEGWFTSALLAVLNNIAIHDSSYSEIMHQVGANLREQYDALEELDTPECLGAHQNRMIFNGTVLGDYKHLIPMYAAEGNRIKVEAGKIQGVVPGTQFLVHNNKAGVKSIGRVVAEDVYGLWSFVKLVEPFFDMPPGCFARVLFSANVPFNLAVDSSSQKQKGAAEAQIDNFVEGHRDNRGVRIVRTNPENARLVASLENSRVLLKRQDPLISTYCAPEYKPSLVNRASSDYWKIVNLAADFDLHLYRENTEHPYKSKVSVDLWLLGNDKRPKGVGYVLEGRADLKHSTYFCYAFELQNDSDVDLWCSIFYLDPSDYSITELYKPPSTYPPLKKHSRLEIGSEDSGSESFTFYIEGNGNYDTGFMKTFISDRYANLSMLEQNVEFGNMTDDRNDDPAAVSQQGEGSWDTITTVIHVYRDSPLDQPPRHDSEE